MRRIMVTTQHIVDMLVKDGRQVNDVAREVGMTRQGLYRRIKRAGLDLSGRYWRKVECNFCGKALERRAKIVEHSQASYCDFNCYAAKRENPGYKPWRQGQRLARAIVGLHFKLEDGNVVDHIDGNNRNNDLSNLRVYASQSDHIKMHHGSLVVPIWDGSQP